MMEYVFNDYIEDEEECHQARVWAFGEEYADLCGVAAFIKAWNTLHGDKLTLKTTGYISEDIPRMLAYWEERKSKGY